MPTRIGWNRDQLLMALRLYMRTPFGRLHGKNPEIIALAKKIGRTPDALAMKACNFASIDPKLNQKGLKGSSQADRAIWAEFEGNPTKLAVEAEEAAERFNVGVDEHELNIEIPTGATERESLVKVRRIQSFFRAAVLISYDQRCAVTGIAIPELLVASHIIPWSASVDQRADPKNGLCLSALIDRALLTLDLNLAVVLSKLLCERIHDAPFDCSLIAIDGKKLRVPRRFPTAGDALDYHRMRV